MQGNKRSVHFLSSFNENDLVVIIVSVCNVVLAFFVDISLQLLGEINYQNVHVQCHYTDIGYLA